MYQSTEQTRKYGKYWFNCCSCHAVSGKDYFCFLNWAAQRSGTEQNNCLPTKSCSTKSFGREGQNLLLNAARCCDSGLHINSTGVC